MIKKLHVHRNLEKIPLPAYMQVADRLKVFQALESILKTLEVII